jgi:hypothetical protein
MNNAVQDCICLLHIASTVSNKAKANPHLSTFGFFLTLKKPKPEKPKELKLGQTLKEK